MQITIKVNETLYRLDIDPERTLLDFLRRDLGLTGAKNGCDGKGICGACTVLVNGQARRSCLLQMGQLDGADVITIEGLQRAGKLHPLQEAFIAVGAVQCGFCTPGMIMAAKALLDKNPSPTREDIVRALRGNLCRCGTYSKVIAAVQRAASRVEESKESKSPPAIGAPLAPKTAMEKVTGELKFADDLPEEGTAFCKIIWPPFPHAEIKKIYTHEAMQVPGVIRVLTAADVPGKKTFGLIHPDQPVLAVNRVRYLGDPVAIIVAESEKAAEAGRDLVRVEYTELPSLHDPEEAAADGAPELHDGGNPVCEFSLRKGSIEDGFRESAIVVEGRFTTPAVEHAYLEPEAGIAEYVDGRVTVRAGCQYPQIIRRQLAAVLDIPEEKVRVIAHPTGGAFGGKTDISIQALLALAAYVTGRRVKLTLTREESLRATVKRHPMVMLYRMGFAQDGRLKAIAGDILADCGAYETLSIPVLEQTTAFSTGPYSVPNVAIRTRGVFTNNPPSSAFRGFGVPQPTFAVESLIDEAALKLGISPIEVRKLNALRPGDHTATGQVLGPDTHLVECLEAIERDYMDCAHKGKDIGMGVACGYKNVGLGLGEHDYANAEIEVLPTERVLLRVGAIDLGQGACTVLAQIAAHELCIDYALVDVEMGDTDRDPDARETNASRQTVMSGNAVLDAVKNLREVVKEVAQRIYGLDGKPVVKGHYIYSSRDKIDVFELARKASRCGERIMAQGTYVAPKTFPIGSPEGKRNYVTFGFFSNLALVKVNISTGRVSVKKLFSAYDVGRAINRLAVEGQLEGGAIMGIGYALSEEYRVHGPKRTTTLAQCGVPRIDSLPDDLIVRLIEKEDSLGPYGAKGVGEMAMIAVAPAITNAVRDATGIRIYDLPATPARLIEWRKKHEDTDS